MSTLAEFAVAFTEVKFEKEPKATPAEDPDISGLVKIILVFGNSFCTHLEPADPDTTATVR